MVNRGGFTLIELVIVAMVSTIVLTVLSSTFLDSWYTQISQQTNVELQRQTRFVVDEIDRQGRGASSVVNSVIVSSVTYTSTASTLVIRLAPLDNNNDQITGDDYFVFRRNPVNTTSTERLVLPDGSSQRLNLMTPLTLGNETAQLQFRYYNEQGTELIPGTDNLALTDKVEATNQATRVFRGRTYSRESQITFKLRNR